MLFVLDEAGETRLTLWCAINSLREDFHYKRYYHENATVMKVIIEAMAGLTINSQIWISDCNDSDAVIMQMQAMRVNNTVNTLDT